MWYDLAAANFPASDTKKRGDAIALRNDVAGIMAPAQIAQAQALARQWRATPTDKIAGLPSLHPSPMRTGVAPTRTAPTDLVLKAPDFPAGLASATPRDIQSPAPQPSFDCAKASDRIGQTICSDAELVRWDARIGEAYRKKVSALGASQRGSLLDEQRRWIASRASQCNQADIAATKSCILQITKARLATLDQQVGQPLQLVPGTAAPTKAARFVLGCQNVDNLLRRSCELAEALLNRDCKSLTNPTAKSTCDGDLEREKRYSSSRSDDLSSVYMLQLVRQADLHDICDADWMPIVAKECAAARARLEKLTADNRAKVAQLRAKAKVDAKAEFEKAADIFGNCMRSQAATLMVTTETADAVAAAALTLCETELRNEARALDYQTAVELWFEGPLPPHCRECLEARKAITDPFLPRLAARVMQDRANAAEPRRGGTLAEPQNPSDLGEASGTAFFVSKDGAALTNAHVVERCREVRVSGGGRTGAARIVARDDENDLALLATGIKPSQSANWRLSVRQGEDIVVYGFPLAGVLASGGNVAAGNVTALAGLGNDSRFLQISAPMQQGNSGGPLLDRNGNVVGIVVAKLNAIDVASITGDIPQNVNFAIKASVAAAFLDAQHVAHAASESGGALSTPDIAERANALTAQVICIR